MGIRDLFKSKGDEQIDPLKDLVLSKLRVGYMVDHDMNIAEAIEAGRIHHQWLPDITRIESRAISPDTEKLYSNMGHELQYGRFQGSVMGISIDYEKGIISGAADSRSPDGAAVGF